MNIYTLPDCPNCDTLKEWLRNKGIEFESHHFDVDIHTDLVMKNIFESPPLIVMDDGRITGSESLFNTKGLDEAYVEWFLSE